ncbi:DUF3349 domain-containing protein [Antrihabitans sp. YC2-6]|uniref:DUF3349 domain-containing protein n=1 Tax=Antrihabitans sp. YC2-6 TaxID=2799498 RepID=UPI0027DB43D7|nr:DUF3349 domain-containing protein [Antrihabitans sp. YC2-6]
MTNAPRSFSLRSAVGWLRAGYPNGVPREDYVALFAVLHRRLTETEVRQVVDELIAEREEEGGQIDREEIEAAIARLAKEQPGENDVERVAAQLAAGGWPVVASAED